ncbi:LOW QUALITY PROTEIN: insulin-like growth factor 2 mRNA-binding protein 1 [Lampetra fluviatilis]
MNKLYIGRLAEGTQAADLERVFTEAGVPPRGRFVLRRGFAFVDCADERAAQKAIDLLSGKAEIQGSTIEIEHSVPRWQRYRKIQVRDIPSSLQWEELLSILAECGSVESCNRVNSEGSSTVVNVVFSTKEQAEIALDMLNNKEVSSRQLKASYIPDEDVPNQSPREAGDSRTMRNPKRGGGYFPRQDAPRQGPDIPVRILVPAQFLGAVFGKEGATIKKITQESRSKIDVQRKEWSGSAEKVVTIHSSEEGSIEACRLILDIVRDEAKSTNFSGEIPLKLLVHNDFVGRIIGREGRNLKRIEQESGTKITISRLQDLSMYNPERTISLDGSTEQCMKAEAEIVKQVWEMCDRDAESAQVSNEMEANFIPGMNLGMVGLFPPSGSMPNTPRGEQETVFLLIPAQAVGTMIGRQGQHIQQLARFAGANIKIAPAETPESKERMVIITGHAEAQFKAQGRIFRKLKEENFVPPREEVRLEVRIKVPTAAAGRVIGRGGRTVTELQNLTCAEVLVPRDQTPDEDDYIFVKIVGHFFASQMAQRKIREIVARLKQRPSPLRQGKQQQQEQD